MAYFQTDDTGVLVTRKDQSGYALNCYGTVAASTLDTTATYQKGCEYIKTDGDVYVNTGTLTTPSWSVKPGVKTITQTVTYDEFTDGGSTAGTLELDNDLPIGAVVTRTIVKGS